MFKLSTVFLVLVIAYTQVKCANLHLFRIVGPSAQNVLRPSDAEMRRAYSLHNLNMMASLNHMSDIMAQKEPFLKRISASFVGKRDNKDIYLPIYLSEENER